ncbi:MAG: hypothetical protein CMA59_01165 [Euryarchaeota archaeon]|nr:hypothetical protein [Euryarchaeota archaeon]
MLRDASIRRLARQGGPQAPLLAPGGYARPPVLHTLPSSARASVFFRRPNMTHQAPGQQGGRGVAALPARLRENLQFSPKECFAHDRKTHGEALGGISAEPGCGVGGGGGGDWWLNSGAPLVKRTATMYGLAF